MSHPRLLYMRVGRAEKQARLLKAEIEDLTAKNVVLKAEVARLKRKLASAKAEPKK